MKWLRSCSKLVGTSGKTLYLEYAHRRCAWDASVRNLTTELCPGWPFCRGASAMSSADIASARHRYLDMYPLTREQLDSAEYVDRLLQIDDAQVRIRRQLRPEGSCQGCAERDHTIATMRAALSAHGIDGETVSICTAAVSAIFRRYFILDGAASTSRTEVRTIIEKALQKEIGPDEVVPSNGEVWGSFIRRTLGLNGSSSGPIRCRLRSTPLHPREVDQLGGS